jgi:LemA protein
MPQHERGTLEAVTQARAAAMAPGQSPADAAAREAALTQALVRLNAVAEAYPDLKANANFTALQAGTRRHRGPDRQRPALLQRQCPRAQHQGRERSRRTSSPAPPACTKAEYFELDAPAEREAPKVSFDPTR